MSWFSKMMKRRSVSRKGNRHSRIACSPGTENRGTSNNLMYKYGYADMVASALGLAKNNVD